MGIKLDSAQYTVTEIQTAFEQHPKIQPCQQINRAQFLLLSRKYDENEVIISRRNYRSLYQPCFQNHNSLVAKIEDFIKKICKEEETRTCPNCHKPVKYLEGHSICLFENNQMRPNCGNSLSRRIHLSDQC